MTVVEQLSGFLLSSDAGRSSTLLYYYTTFPCVRQLFLSYRELYSFQTSVMNLQKRSKFYLFFLSILKKLPEGINVFIYSLVCSDVNPFLCCHLMVAYPSHLVMKLLNISARHDPTYLSHYGELWHGSKYISYFNYS